MLVLRANSHCSHLSLAVDGGRHLALSQTHRCPEVLRVDTASLVQDLQFVQVLFDKLGLVVDTYQVLQQRSFAALAHWVELELRLASGLLRSQVLEQCRISQ